MGKAEKKVLGDFVDKVGEVLGQAAASLTADDVAVFAKLDEAMGQQVSFILSFCLGNLVKAVGADEADRLVCQTIAALKKQQGM